MLIFDICCNKIAESINLISSMYYINIFIQFKNTRLFLAIQKAEEYIANNKELKNSTIVIVNDKNDELEHLLNLIERNF